MTEERENWNWIGRGVWAVADQGLFALSSALINILLARWLAPTEYGAFVLAYSVFLFIGVFHTALLTEPLLVFGAGKYADHTRSYLALLLRAHWALAGFGSLLMIFVGLVLNFTALGPLAYAIFGLALATPFSLLLWFARRAAYLQSQIRLATVASGTYLILLLSGVFALATLGFLSVFAVMAVISTASAISGLWLLRRVHQLRTDKACYDVAPTRRSVIADHWHYGRWAMGTGLLMWIPINFFFVVLSVVVNIEASATFKAVSNLVLPLLQTNAALGSLLLPALALRTGNRQQFKKLIFTSLILLMAGAVAYSLMLGAFGYAAINLLYGGKYDSAAPLLWLLLPIPILDATMIVLSNALRSLQRPAGVFWSQVAVAALLLTAGVAATRSSGLWGAAAGVVFANLLGAIILGVGVLRQLKPRNCAGPITGRLMVREITG